VSAGPHDETIVVSGLPRAGTSLLMQMLGAGGVPLLCDDARPADEGNPRGYFEYAPARAGTHDARWLEAARGRAVKLVAPLVQGLPAGRAWRVLLVERDLREVLASQRAMLLREAAQRAERGEAVDEIVASLRADPARLEAAFGRALAATRAALTARTDVALLALEHRALLADAGAAAARIADFLGRDLDSAAMAAAVDPGLWRQRA